VPPSDAFALSRCEDVLRFSVDSFWANSPAMAPVRCAARMPSMAAPRELDALVAFSAPRRRDALA